MDVMLTCDACGTATGPFGSYEEWEDTARKLGWAIGEDVVLCALCSGSADPGPPPPHQP